jgi:hypothetical protein
MMIAGKRMSWLTHGFYTVRDIVIRDMSQAVCCHGADYTDNDADGKANCADQNQHRTDSIGW